MRQPEGAVLLTFGFQIEWVARVVMVQLLQHRVVSPLKTRETARCESQSSGTRPSLNGVFQPLTHAGFEPGKLCFAVQWCTKRWRWRGIEQGTRMILHGLQLIGQQYGVIISSSPWETCFPRQWEPGCSWSWLQWVEEPPDCPRTQYASSWCLPSCTLAARKRKTIVVLFEKCINTQGSVSTGKTYLNRPLAGWDASATLLQYV